MQDPCHIHTNAWEDGIASAGFKPCLEVFIHTAVFEYGPFSKSMYSTYVKEAVVEIEQNVQPDDALLLRWWPAICKDMGWSSNEDTSRGARQRFLSTLSAGKVAHCHQPSNITTERENDDQGET
jgi:hypothetical protein